MESIIDQGKVNESGLDENLGAVRCDRSPVLMRRLTRTTVRSWESREPSDRREAAQIGIPLTKGGVRAVVASDDGQHMLTIPRSSSHTDL